MICKQCGNEIAPDTKFCASCGTPVERVAPIVNEIEGQPVENPYTQSQYTQPFQPQYTQPAQSQYTQPVQPQYVQPSQPQYTQQAQPQYAQPVQPQYSQPVQPQYTQPMQQYGQPVQPQYFQGVPIDDPRERGMSGTILGFGIAALACACFFYTAVLGIIFGAIAKSKASEYSLSYPLIGRAKTGKILGNVGFILGIVFTSLLLLAILGSVI